MFSEKMIIFTIQNKQLKLTIMEKDNVITKERNYRITIIFKDGITVEKFYEECIAKDTIRNMKKLVPSLFVGAALEEKSKGWNVIWTLGND